MRWRKPCIFKCMSWWLAVKWVGKSCSTCYLPHPTFCVFSVSAFLLVGFQDPKKDFHQWIHGFDWYLILQRWMNFLAYPNGKKIGHNLVGTAALSSVESLFSWFLCVTMTIPILTHTFQSFLVLSAWNCNPPPPPPVPILQLFITACMWKHRIYIVTFRTKAKYCRLQVWASHSSSS